MLMLALPKKKKKKENRKKVRNYRPVSILSNLSEVYENCLFNVMETLLSKILSKYQIGFRVGFYSQQCPIKEIKDKEESFAAILNRFVKRFWLRFTSFARCKITCKIMVLIRLH